MNKILIIEDDPAISLGLEEALKNEHYDVTTEADGALGYERALGGEYDLILLDLMLPSKDGMDICKDLRSNSITIPILMLTSKKEEIDKILGLEIGADDYVTKPFSVRELLARIKAILRRSTEIAISIEKYSFANISIDFKKQEASKNNENLELSSTEYKILKYLIEHEGEVISRNKFLDKVWGYESFPSTRTVDNFILSIRKQIEDDPSNPKHLITVHKAGYKFVK